MREYLICMFAAAFVTLLATPAARALALKANALAEVRDRDVHDKPTPRWGGLAMFLGVAIGIALASKLPLMSSVFDANRTALGVLAAVAILVLLGLVDDRWPLDAPIKLTVQVFAAGVMALNGVVISWLPLGSTIVLDPTVGVLITVLLVLITVNAVNFVDGLDGLAAGVVGIAAFSFFLYAYTLSVVEGYLRATLPTLLSAIVVGVVIGFLPHNFYPARIFMGDTGSMMLGLLLAAISIMLIGQLDPVAIDSTAALPALLPVMLPLLVIGIPLADLLLAIFRRTKAGKNPFTPDKKHLHHLLLERGHSQPGAALLMYAIAAVFALPAVSVAFVPIWLSSVSFILGLSVLIVFLVKRPRSKKYLPVGELS
ncbi:MAG: MraY family glycosyltransferase [Candidatus Nanopelagicales bacterium]